MNSPALVRFVAVTILSALMGWAQSPPPNMPVSTAARVLEQATWGPTAQSITDLRTAGFDAWFAKQQSAPISTYANLPNVGPDGKAFTNNTGNQTQFLENALYNPDQLRQRVAFALSEIWVVSHEGDAHASFFPPILNIFLKDAFANYTVLMKDVTLNPAMGNYLNMVNNRKATATSTPNENYARELMQLFTIGLQNLGNDGSLANTTQTYSPATVTALAAALTGWTYAPQRITGETNYYDPMVPVETQHDVTKKVLTFTYPDGTTHTANLAANQTAQIDLDQSLAAVFAHPSVAPFVCKQLIQHLVTSNPSSAYVQRVVTVFNDNQGNLGKTVYAILTDPEARAGDAGSSAESANFGHLREPVLLFESILRGLNGNISDASTLYSYTSALGQSLLDAPSVFSYFSPGYKIGTPSGPALAPEFQIHTTQTATNRANYIYNLVYNGHLDANTTVDISPFVTAASNNANLIALINKTFFHSQMSSSVQSAITTAITPITAAADKAKAGLYIALTSSEFQIIH